MVAVGFGDRWAGLDEGPGFGGEVRVWMMGAGHGGSRACLLRTHEHEMVAPGVVASFNETLLDGDDFGGGVVCDAEVGGPLSQVVEGACGVGVQPGDGEGRAAGLFGLGVDEGVGEGFDETGLAGTAGGDAELDSGVGVSEGTVVGLFGLDLRWVFWAGGGVNVDGSHVVS